MDQENFRKLISREPETPGHIAMLAGLKILSFFYSLAVSIRNFLYDRRILRMHRVNKPVISIGNITAGGTGKTPMVVWLCDLLKDREKKAGILTRGYKTNSGEMNDEPALLEANCTNAKVIVDPNRSEGATKAIEQFGCDILIMDDGFQHRKLSRVLDILLIDATVPFGYGRVLPAGFLREPLKGISRAQAAIITRCDLVDPGELEDIELKLRRHKPDIIIARSQHKAVEAIFADARKSLVDHLEGMKLWAFCGIGNPDAFEKTLKKVGCELVGSRSFPDHHQYSINDIHEITAQAQKAEAQIILTTEKDWSKVRGIIENIQTYQDRPEDKVSNMLDKDMKIGYLAIKIQITKGQEELIKLIDSALAGRINTDTR
jgi:tetraacyldisaccharide 4'-kinase